MIPALVAFRVLGGLAYDAAPVWLPGCGIALGISGALWLWILWRSDEPFLRTLATLGIGTTLWFFVYFAIFFVYAMVARHDMVSATHDILLGVCCVAVFYLRRALIRRNGQVEDFARGTQKT
jgi:hypothetical protein